MRGAKRRLPLVALALLAAVLTPTERAEAQSVPNVFWGVTSYIALESTEDVFAVQASRVSSAGIDVSYTIGGTATCGTDYIIAGANCNARTGTFTLPASSPAFTLVDVVSITFLGDAVSDTGETVILTLTDGADYNLGAGITTTITIVENSGRSAFRISGRPQVNGVLTGNRVCADPDGEGSLTYEWLWSDDISAPGQRWRQLAGATSQSYTLQQSDLGNYFRLKVQHTDGKGLPGSVYTQIVGPIGPVAFDNTVKFSRDDYNVREGDPLRPTLTFSSPTTDEQTFVIEFNPCDAELLEDINADAYVRDQYTGAEHFAATHSVTVPAGVTRHTFSLPVPLDAEIEDAETFVMGFNVLPAGFTIGDQTDATNAGTQAHVQITDVNLVPENWSLKPGGVSAGDQFRLLFRTENERNAQSGDIGVYDTFVRNRIGGATTGHADIRQYKDTFRVVGSTNTVDAAWHTATGIMVSGEPSHTPFSHPIHWLNGAKIADDYNDFWDGNWDDNAQTKGRNANGQTSSNNRGPNTGTKTGTTHATAGTKATMHLGHSANTRWGGAAANQNPINQGGIPVGNNNVYIGLSGIFLPLDVSAANPLVTIETKRTRVNEGDAIRYTLRAVPAPSSPVTVNVKVTQTGDFVESGSHGPQPVTIGTDGVGTLTVRTHDDDLGEPDGEATVSIGTGTGYRTLAAYDTVMTVVTDDDEASTLSTSVRLGNGSSGPARTGANVDFTFSLAAARQESELQGIRTQLAWGGDVISPRSDRPTTWDQFAVNPAWKPDGSARVNHRGAYVRPWLESSIIRGQRSFYHRVHVKNRAEAGGEVGNGWIAMRVDTDAADHYDAAPGAEWACMPVGNGTCPSAWPGVPTATIVPLDKPTADANHGRVRSGNDARYRVTINPAPGTGETRRVYLKTWEVFINAIDPPKELAKTEISGRGGSVRDPNFRAPRGFKSTEDRREFDQVDNRYKWYRFWLGTPDRNGQREVQFEDYTHVDVGSSGTADFTIDKTKVWRSTENMTGRNYWAMVQEDVAYSVGDSSRAEVRTQMFEPNQAACWFGHAHYPARLTTVDGEQVYFVGGMGITACLVESEIDELPGSASRVWTGCKPAYGHRSHPYTHGGHTHHRHHHGSNTRLGDGSCPGGQMQTDGGDSQDGQTDDPPEDPFPDPGALGFSDVTAGGMTLSWPEREVDHYLVYWAENVADADARSARVDAGTLTYTITGLKPGTEYAFIVYSQDYDEVTPTGYQRTAAAGSTIDTTPQLPDYGELKATVRGYADEQASDSDHARRWMRVLAALGDEDAIAAGHAPMTASEAQGYADRGWGRWDEVVEALTEVESREATEPEPDPIPELSLSGGGGVDEGGSASFTIHADPAPAADVTVSVAVAQSGDYLDAPGAGTRTITLATGATTASLTVATVNDGADEPDGSVSVSLNAGAGYTVSSSNAAATVAVRDDDEPTPVVGPQLPDYGELKATVRGYADEQASDSDHARRWMRVLAALGDEDAIAAGHAPMTASEAQGYADRGWGRWDEVVEALTELESRETTEPEPDPIPELSLSAGSGVDEGGSASFTIHADPAPAADVTVSVAVAQSGDYLDAPGAGIRTVTLATGATTASLAVATVNDGADEADGSVSVSLNAGTGYTVASSSATATVAVRDDDAPEPEVSISAGGEVTEGAAASFTVTASPAPAAALDVAVTVAQSGDFAVSGATGSKTVTIPSSGSATLTVATDDDGSDEADGSIRVRIDAGTGYTVASSPNDAATVTVRDDDDPPPASSCVSGTQWKRVEGYYKSNAGKAPNYGSNWYRVLIAYRQERTDKALPDWTGPTAEPTTAYTVKEAEDGEQVWSGWTPVREVLECLARASGQSFVPLLPAASNPAREGVVRIVNPGDQDGSVNIAATDDAGWRPEPLQLHLGAGQSVELTSADLEAGNAAKGLPGGIGMGTGDWRLTISSDSAIRVQPHIRSADGRLAAMDAVAPLRDGEHRVAVLHPADDAEHTGLLRLVNRGSRSLGVRITALDDGAAPGGAVSLELPAYAAATFTVSELERGGAGLEGALGDGRGLWRLRVASTGELAVMALAEDPVGHLENLSDPALAARLESGVHAVARFPSAYGPAGRPGTLRIVNDSAAGGTVAIRPHDAEGRALDPLRLRLGAGEAVNLNAWDLELGNPAKGLSGRAGPAPGDWRIEVESDLELQVLPLVETPAAHVGRPADAER